MDHTTSTKALKEALDIALLKKNVMHKVAEDKSATKYAYLIIIAAAALGMIGQLVFGIKVPFLGVIKPSLGAALGQAVMQVISTVIGLYIISFIAKSIFKGHAKHDAFFRVASFSMIVMFLGVFPRLSIIAGIWGLVLFFVILKTIHKLTTGGVIGTFIVTLIAGFVLSLILAPVYAMLGLSGMGGGSFSPTKGGFLDKNSGGFEMNIPGEDGGSVKFGEGGMKITTDDGEVMEINIPNLNFSE